MRAASCCIATARAIALVAFFAALVACVEARPVDEASILAQALHSARASGRLTYLPDPHNVFARQRISETVDATDPLRSTIFPSSTKAVGDGVSADERVRTLRALWHESMAARRTAHSETGASTKASPKAASSCPGYSPATHQLEQDALLSLYAVTHGANWTSTQKATAHAPAREPYGWGNTTEGDTAHCSWAGVTCISPDGLTAVVISVSLPSFNLRGDIGAVHSALQGLSFVIEINLNSNTLSGALPAGAFESFCVLKYIQIANNALTGALPRLHGMPQLQALVLSSNSLVGTLPAYSLPALLIFAAAGNALSGDLSVALQSVNASQLTQLQLSYNRFTGGVPSVAHFPLLAEYDLSFNALRSDPSPVDGTAFPLFAQNTALNVISFGGNELEGTIPDWALPNLSQLSLRNGLLTGALPELRGCPKLTSIDFSGNALTGGIPEYEWLPELLLLQLGFNRLSGPLPSLRGCPLMLVFDVGTNALTGTIPNSYSALHNLTSLVLSSNRLVGPLPLFTGSCSIQNFDLSGNALNGTLTAQHFCGSGVVGAIQLQRNAFSGSLAFLESLVGAYVFSLSDNPFGTPLPDTLPASLESLLASGCGLTGTIPAGWTQYRRLKNLIIARNGLTLPIPSLLQLERFDISNNPLSTNLQAALLPFWNPAFLSADIGPQPALTTLDLTGCNLTGVIPPTLLQPLGGSLFDRLQNLLLAENPHLVGELPSAYSRGNALLQIISLNVSYTGLTGEINADLATNWPFIQLLSIDGTAMRARNNALPNYIAPIPTAVHINLANGYQCPQFQLNIISGRPALLSLDDTYYGRTRCQCLDGFFGINGVCRPCTGTHAPAGTCSCVGQVIRNCMPVGDTFVACSSTQDGNPCYTDRSTGSSSSSSSSRVTALSGTSAVTWPFDNSTGLPMRDPPESFCGTGRTGRLCAQCEDEYYASGPECLRCPPDGLIAAAAIAQCASILGMMGWVYYKTPTTISAQKGDAAFQILVFHGQLLGALLNSNIVLPRSFLGLSSGTATATSFQLSSLLAVQCLLPRLSAQVALTVAMPVVYLVLVVIGYDLSRAWAWLRRRLCGDSPAAANESDGALRIDTYAASLVIDGKPVSPASPSSTADSGVSVRMSLDTASTQFEVLDERTRRIYRFLALLVEMLNLQYFEVAGASLAALGCTDERDPSGTAHLNSYPAIACDSAWRNEIFPSALLGLGLWVIGLPVCAVVVYWRSSPVVRHLVMSSFFGNWRRDARWFELVVLARRVLIVLFLAAVPSYGFSLSLALICVLLLSTLLQQSVNPYHSAFDNRAEVVSLCLLLISFFSSALTNSSTNVLDTTGWFVVLAIANGAFLFGLALVIGGRVVGRKCGCIDTAKEDAAAEAAARAAVPLSASSPVSGDATSPAAASRVATAAADAPVELDTRAVTSPNAADDAKQPSSPASV